MIKAVGYYKSSNYLPNHESEDYIAHSANKISQTKKKNKNHSLNPYYFKKDEIVCFYFISFHLLSLLYFFPEVVATSEAIRMYTAGCMYVSNTLTL